MADFAPDDNHQLKDMIQRFFEAIGFIQSDDIKAFSTPTKEGNKQLSSMLWLLFGWIGLAAAFVWVCLSAYLDISNCKHWWLAPSGAILVLAAITVEYLSSITHKFLDPRFHFFLTPLFGNFHSFFRMIGFILAALGTVLWAYGHMWI